MLSADIIIVAVLGISVILGIVRGFVREAVALLTWLAAVWIAWRYSAWTHVYFGGHLDTPELKAWAGRVIVFILVLLVGSVIGSIASWATRTAAGLSIADRLLGLLFGFTRGAVVVGLAAIIGTSLKLDAEPWWQQAKLRPFAEYLGDWLQGYAGRSEAYVTRAIEAAKSDGGGS
jgi:membrane protein required for colicin V production